jgi:uncharacterized protein DUF5681
MLQPSTNQAEPMQVGKGAPHRWQKGVSGNPAGRAKHVLPDGRTVREAARDATPQALALLLQVIDDPKAALPLRIAAAQAVLRTGHADALPDDKTDQSLVVNVVSYAEANPKPVPGVLNSPIPEHIWREPEVVVTPCEVTQ